ncbi:T9SS type A sorting domain-containing protein [bacterium]|nr:T9SS type A sorting domain-containing protein [bacterium]
MKHIIHFALILLLSSPAFAQLKYEKFFETTENAFLASDNMLLGNYEYNVVSNTGLSMATVYCYDHDNKQFTTLKTLDSMYKYNSVKFKLINNHLYLTFNGYRHLDVYEIKGTSMNLLERIAVGYNNLIRALTDSVIIYAYPQRNKMRSYYHNFRLHQSHEIDSSDASYYSMENKIIEFKSGVVSRLYSQRKYKLFEFKDMKKVNVDYSQVHHGNLLLRVKGKTSGSARLFVTNGQRDHSFIRSLSTVAQNAMVAWIGAGIHENVSVGVVVDTTEGYSKISLYEYSTEDNKFTFVHEINTMKLELISEIPYDKSRFLLVEQRKTKRRKNTKELVFNTFAAGTNDTVKMVLSTKAHVEVGLFAANRNKLLLGDSVAYFMANSYNNDSMQFYKLNFRENIIESVDPAFELMVGKTVIRDGQKVKIYADVAYVNHTLTIHDDLLFTFQWADNDTITYNRVLGHPTSVAKTPNHSLQIYPNPSTGMVHVVSDKLMSHVAIYNTNGQLVAGSNQKLNQLSFNLAGLAKGVYLVRAQTEAGIICKPVYLLQ